MEFITIRTVTPLYHSLKENTFKCVARALVVSLFAEDFQEAIDYVNSKLVEH